MVVTCTAMVVAAQQEPQQQTEWPPSDQSVEIGNFWEDAERTVDAAGVPKEAPQMVDAQEGDLMGPIEPFFVDSFKCQATDTRGCTADRTECLKSSPNYVFLKESLHLASASAAGNGKKWCALGMDPASMQNIEFTLPSGVVIKQDHPQRVCVNAHAESGSGARNWTVTAWQHCVLSGTWFQFK